jgi:hypothetical protein
MAKHSILSCQSLGLFAAIVALAGITNVSAQTVYLTFSGGSGTPFVVTWSSPITYTLTSTSANSGVNPYFVFKGITNINSAVPVDTVGAIPGGGPTYTSTGSGSGDGTQTINSFYTTSAHGVITANDLVFRATLDTTNSILTSGDAITLTAGHLQNSTNYFGTMPTSGYYETFITDASYQPNLGAGSAVPEPSTYAAIAGAAMLGFAGWSRRRRRQAAVATAATPPTT